MVVHEVGLGLESDKDGLATPRSVVAVGVTIENHGSASHTFDASAVRFELRGAGGRQVVGVPVAATDGDVPRSQSASPSSIAPVTIAPGGSRRLSIAFAGLSGIDAGAAAAARLVLSDGSAIVLAAPATAAPGWAQQPSPFSMTLAIGGRSGPNFSQMSLFSYELLNARGGFVFGLGAGFGLLRKEREEDLGPPRYLASYNWGARIGWILHSTRIGGLGLGPFAGVDYFSASDNSITLQPAEQLSAGMLGGFVALRMVIPAGVPSYRGGWFQAARPWSPLGRMTFDIGYSRWSGDRSFSAGGGVYFSLGCPLVFVP